MLYRIFTENKNLKAVERIVSRYFKGFTIIKSMGYWKLQAKSRIFKNIIIEITCCKAKKNIVNKLTKEIKAVNRQEAILIQEINNKNWLV